MDFEKTKQRQNSNGIARCCDRQEPRFLVTFDGTPDQNYSQRVCGKCAKFLISNGALITDTNNFHFPSMKENLMEEFHDAVKIFKSIAKGPRSIRKEVKKINESRLKKKMYLIVGQKEATKYAESIWQEWNKLNCIDQLLINLDNFSHKLITALNKKPDYKKRLSY